MRDVFEEIGAKMSLFGWMKTTKKNIQGSEADVAIAHWVSEQIGKRKDLYNISHAPLMPPMRIIQARLRQQYLKFHQDPHISASTPPLAAITSESRI